MPKAGKPSHGFGGVGGEARSQIAHGTKMLVKLMRILPTALWWRVSPVQAGCIRSSHIPADHMAPDESGMGAVAYHSFMAWSGVLLEGVRLQAQQLEAQPSAG